MLYLIGGAPRTGKSTIAKQLAQSIRARLVSTDELDKSHSDFSVVFFGDASKNTLTPDQRLQLVRQEAKQLYPRIEDTIKKCSDRHQDMVIEGVHLFPAYVAGLGQAFGKQNIKSIFIGSTDVEAILQGMKQNTSPNNWPKDFGQYVHRQIASFVEAFSRYLQTEAKQYNLLYRERSRDFGKDTMDIMKELTTSKE